MNRIKSRKILAEYSLISVLPNHFNHDKKPVKIGHK